MSDSEQRIAKITDTFLGFEDHGLLSASVTFDYGSSSQGIGHRAFGSTSTVLVTCTYTEVQKIDPLPTERGKPFDIAEWAA